MSCGRNVLLINTMVTWPCIYLIVLFKTYHHVINKDMQSSTELIQKSPKSEPQ